MEIIVLKICLIAGFIIAAYVIIEMNIKNSRTDENK